MTAAEIGLLGIVLGLVAALINHMVTDARTRANLRALQSRVKKLDGIDSNGD